MANITFSEASGVADSIYGNSQAPIRRFIEKKGESFEQSSVIKELFNFESSSHWAEKVTGMTAMDGFKPVGKGAEYPVDGMQETYSKTLEHVTWKNSFSIEEEIIEDSKTMDLRKKPAAFVTGYYRTREKFGAALYAGAVSGKTKVSFSGWNFDVTSGDNVSLFSTAHPSILKKANQSNKFSDEFSADSLSAAETSMQNFRGDNGEILDVTPDTILIPNHHDLKKRVFEVIGADKDPATANNGFNYQFGRWNVIVWNYLNEYLDNASRPWMLLDSRYNKECSGAVWYDRTGLKVKSEIASNDANVWKGSSRFTAGFYDWRFACLGGAEGGTSLLA